MICTEGGGWQISLEGCVSKGAYCKRCCPCCHIFGYSLLPDWRQLPNLKDLRIVSDSQHAPEHHLLWAAAWGSGSLSALTALIRLNLDVPDNVSLPGGSPAASGRGRWTGWVEQLGLHAFWLHSTLTVTV